MRFHFSPEDGRARPKDVLRKKGTQYIVKRIMDLSNLLASLNSEQCSLIRKIEKTTYKFNNAVFAIDFNEIYIYIYTHICMQVKP